MKYIKHGSIICGFTVLFIMLLATAACAKEVTLGDFAMKDLISHDKVDQTTWGRLDKASYISGEEWASTWGAGTFFRDYEDMLEAKPYSEKDVTSGKEAYLFHKIISDPMPDNAAVKMTIDLITGPKPKTTNCEIWFGFRTKANEEDAELVTVQPFRIVSSPAGLSVYFASTTNWPFTAKAFDRSSPIELDYNTEYEIVCTMSPTSEGVYRFVAEVYEGGTKIGAGIVDEYGIIAQDTFNRIQDIRIIGRALADVSEDETIAYIKNIKLSASFEDVKPEAVFTPANGADGVDRTSEFCIKFTESIMPVASEQIEAEEGVYVENVALSENQKELTFSLGGLKSDTEYNIKIKGITALGSETSFDYDWSFRTGYQVNFGAAYLKAQQSELFSAEMSDIPTNTDGTANIPKAFDSGWSQEYLDGAYGSRYDTAQYGVKAEDGWLVIGQNIGWADRWKPGNISKRITQALGEGDTMKLSARVKLLMGGIYSNKAVDVHIRLTDDGSPISSLTLLRLTANDKGVYALGLGAANQSLSGWNDTGCASYCARLSSAELEVLKDMELTLTAEFIPADGAYRADIKLSDDSGAVVLLGTMAEISEELVLSFRNLEIETYSDWPDPSVRHEQLAVRDVKIDSLHSGLTAGTNDIYVDYTNTESEEFTADVLVVVDRLENGDFVVEKARFFEISGQESSTAKLSVDLDDTAPRRVRVFILNDKAGMIPLAAETIIQ